MKVGSWKSVVAVLATVGIVLPAVPAAAHGHKGTTYYVGKWGRPMFAGRSAAAPFLTIQQCADVMVPGDTCLIMSGTYEETVVPAHSGTAGQPITYRPAPGATVTISGTTAVSGWTPVTSADVDQIAQTDPYAQDSPFSAAVAAGHVYSTAVDLGADVTTVQIFTDKKMDVEAQWPHPGLELLDPAFQYAKTGSTLATIVDPALTRPAGYWTGARVQTNYWYITATGSVASSDVGSVTLDIAPPCIHKIVPNDTRYALTGKIGELANPGTWFYDATGKRLYLYSEDDLDQHAVAAKTRKLAFDLRNTSYIKVAGVDLFAASIETGVSSTNVVIDGITAKYLSHYTDITRGATDCGSTVTRGVADTGIVLNGTDNQVVNSDLAYSAGNGIALRGQRNSAINNVIHDVDYLGTYAAGVAVQGNSQTVRHNTIYRVGRSGVNLQWDNAIGGTPGPDSIAYNDISQYAKLSLDVAAVYTCCGSDMLQTSIDHNVLHDPAPRKGVTSFGVTGVYADNGQSNIVIADNVGWGNAEGTVMLNGLGSCSCNNGVYNNVGGGTFFYVKGANQSTGTKVFNNLGTFRGLTGATDGGMVLSNNLPDEVDPLFVDAANHDYRLTDASPARNCAIALPGITDGSTDAVPSCGAYQYGATAWTAGASR
ncbi:right-handed parallel beta-helix repeat-containing protein [Hamadaea sp. NPDC051192]|uniref:right-handed parallel beta-helix repeat-containing protein n=1 Tax=Hamadaea sp. NPDC051192 TaxID=3154940 RepID=UPI0034122942